MEEFACAGHAVGFKQTILFPFVTGGSLINFCDVLMAGGTSALRHGEIGSSYVHFNFTPRGDKATASLLGDVPRGVMLDCDPIFLGGQGGLVGPARVEFGSLIPAGCVTRRDILEPGRLVAEEQILRGPVPFNPEIYTAVSRIVGNCVNYIGQLHALKAWYLHVRSRFMNGDAWRRACCEGGVSALDLVLKERIERMHELAAKVRVSAAALKAGHASAGAGELEVQERFVTRWPSLKRRLAAGFGAGDRSALDTFLSSIPSAGGTGFVAAVQSWSRDTRAAGRFWLDGIVKQANSLWAPEMQSFQPPR
jgi:UDP-N-acetylglucosamine/UDP-N-acetylgalactosamine diphosphorylase